MRILLGVSLLIAMSAHAAAQTPAGACAANGKPAKLNFTFKDVDGRKVSLSAFKGKVIILDFWATWCVPCKAEIPGFIELQKKYGDRGLQIVGLSVDEVHTVRSEEELATLLVTLGTDLNTLTLPHNVGDPF